MHWFLSFLWKRPSDLVWHPVDAVTKDQHPLDYIARARAANDQHEFCLLHFREIPEDVYRRAAA